MHRLERKDYGMIRALVAIGASACAACASPAITLSATVSQERSLELRLRNVSAQAIGYNLCASALERRSGAAWQRVASNRICTMELRSLAPGEEARYVIPLAGLAPGGYRARARIDGFPPEVATEPVRIP